MSLHLYVTVRKHRHTCVNQREQRHGVECVSPRWPRHRPIRWRLNQVGVKVGGGRGEMFQQTVKVMWRQTFYHVELTSLTIFLCVWVRPCRLLVSVPSSLSSALFSSASLPFSHKYQPPALPSPSPSFLTMTQTALTYSRPQTDTGNQTGPITEIILQTGGSQSGCSRKAEPICKTHQIQFKHQRIRLYNII